jgi:4-hydroxybenzoate polyprenyltransferase
MSGLTGLSASVIVAVMPDLSSSAVPVHAADPELSWSAVARLIRLKSQTGTLLLLLPILWSLVLAARGLPSLRLLCTFMVGSFLMRSAGVVLNDLADRSFDRHVARTRDRPLASGQVTPRQARSITILLIGLAGMLVMTLNLLTMLLSPIALLLAGLYPFAKRVVHVPQAVLGMAFGWGTIMAWTATRGTLDAPAWIIFFAAVCWAIGYDTIYALQDREDDRRIGVKSSALFFGSFTWLVVGVSLASMLTLVGTAGWLSEIGTMLYWVLAAVSVLCVRQIIELRRPIVPSRAFRLFHRHVWFGSAILAGLIGGFLW